MRACYCCEKEIPSYTEHLKYDDEIICTSCFDEWTTTHYYVGGEYIGSDEDENITHVYDWEDEPMEGEE